MIIQKIKVNNILMQNVVLNICWGHGIGIILIVYLNTFFLRQFHDGGPEYIAKIATIFYHEDFQVVHVGYRGISFYYRI